MKIEIDYNPTPSNVYFILVFLNNKEAISFDCTTKGQRVIKQILIENKPFPNDQKITSEWDTLVIENGNFVKRYHARWIDMDKKDWVNGDVWETVAEKPITEDVKNKLLHFSQLISDNYDNLITFKNEMNEFENLLKSEIDKFLH